MTPQAAVADCPRAALQPAQLARLSELLDVALELDGPSQAQWLSSLQGTADESMAVILRALLHRHPEATDALAPGAALQALAADLGPQAEGLQAWAGPEAGQAVGPYRLLRLLGVGGMGEVWLAERADGALKRQVALKLPMLGLRRSLLLQRFERERDILAALEHPHIARLYDAGVAEDGQPYLALEFVEGQPIDRYCREAALPVAARVRLLLQVAEAVAYAHGRLVLHRDLKPGNVLVTRQGEVRLLDFGIARLMVDEGPDAVAAVAVAASALTRAWGPALTLAYASPEQIRGEALGTASDVYSLGVVAYEVLCGQRPYRLKRGSGAELEEAIASQAVPPASRLADDAAVRRALAGDLDAILNRALKKSVAERYASADALAQDLRRHLAGERVQARPDSLAYRSARFVQRHRRPLAAAAVTTAAFGLALGAGATALVVGALLLGLAGALWQARRAQAQARRAREQERIARTEAHTAQAVQEFLERIFQASSGDQDDPQRARSRTAKQLLDEGAARAEAELAGVPAVRLRVMHTLARLYTQLGEAETALSLLQRRAALCAQTHGPASVEHLEALAESGDMLVQLGHAEAAHQALQAVASQLAAHRDPSGRVQLALDRGWATYHERCGTGEGLAEAGRVVAALRQRPAGKDLVSALDTLASLHYNRNEFAGARTALREALALMQAMDAGARSLRGSVLINLADVEMRLGEVAAALVHYRDAALAAEADQGPGGRDAVMLRTRWAQALLIDDRPGEAVQALEPAAQAAAAWGAAPHRAEAALFALGNLGRALRLHGQPGAAARWLAQARALECEAVQASPVCMSTALYRAQAAMDLGRFDEAQAELAQARALAQQFNHPPALLRGVATEEVRLRLLRRAALQPGTGEPDALADWLALDPRAPDPGSRNQAGRLAENAEIHALAGQAGPAVELAQAGLQELQRAPSWGDAGRAERLKLVLAAAWRQRDPHAAAQALDEALASMQQRLDRERSPALASAWALRARLHEALAEPEAARQADDRARAMLARHEALGPQFIVHLAPTDAHP